MLINYIKVFQQSGATPIDDQASTSDTNIQTGAGGPIKAAKATSGAVRQQTWSECLISLGGAVTFCLASFLDLAIT
jgi:hypothetical protein